MEHLKEAMERKSHPNLYILHFEDMKKDPVSEIKKLDKFLGTKLSDQQIQNVSSSNISIMIC